ncbi:hypothetical protein [Absidia glauca]|uniref:Uncharacterized protein n=1 Tax=Absidia glauca TaxID=4829 RepID=A0A163KWM2_ABSGL|nr:hypothetical protein [Absidia glauca]
MSTRYSSPLDPDAFDSTLPSIPEIYVGYVHPTLVATLRLIFVVATYCFTAVTKLLLMVLRTILWPVYMMARYFIVPPVVFLYQVCRGLYPIAVFLSMAVICGVIIGCCAGFTAEALSSFFINATWGPQPSSKAIDDDICEDAEEEYNEDDMESFDEDDNDYNSNSRNAGYDYLDEYTESPNHGKPSPKTKRSSLSALSSPLSSISSIWNGNQGLDDDSYSDDDGVVDDDDDGSSRYSTTDDYGRTFAPFSNPSTTAPSPSSIRNGAKDKGKQAMHHQHRPSIASYTPINTTRRRANQQKTTHLSE